MEFKLTAPSKNKVENEVKVLIEPCTLFIAELLSAKNVRA